MRVLFAGLFVFIGSLVAFSVCFSILPSNTTPVVIGFGMAIFMVILCLGALILFNLGKKQKSEYTSLEELKKQGLLESSQYEATRAFEVEEFEDEGMHFFVELKDGSTLFLAGQYLYEYAPADGKFEKKRARRFPCRKFTVHRHKRDHFVIDLDCEGEPFEPEFEAPPFEEKDYRSDDFPGDGDIISNRTYDQIRADPLARR